MQNVLSNRNKYLTTISAIQYANFRVPIYINQNQVNELQIAGIEKAIESANSGNLIPNTKINSWIKGLSTRKLFKVAF